MILCAHSSILRFFNFFEISSRGIYKDILDGKLAVG